MTSTMVVTLGTMIGTAVDAALTVLPSVPGVGMVAVVYTPAGGTGTPVFASIRIDEMPAGGTQRRSAHIRLLCSDVSGEPTDGATVHDTDTAITWTIRTARRQVASYLCEAWA